MASRTTLSIALLLAFSAGGAAIAQAPTELGTVTVMAPRITYTVKRERGSTIPVEVTVVEQSAQVRFDDLDLTRTTDLYTLEGRVGDAAANICEALAQQYPDGTPSTSTCTRRAIDDAMAQVRQTANQTVTTTRETAQ